MTLKEIAARCGARSDAMMSLTPFICAEDGSEYAVWRVTAGGENYVLKRAKPCEAAIYRTYFKEPLPGVPRLLGECCDGGQEYLLVEYVPGEDMTVLGRAELTKALDALIAIQGKYWGAELECEKYSFAHTLERRRERGAYLCDTELQGAYEKFLACYESAPRTLCHDDLLPFNVRISDTGATLIDWECAGILPYPTSVARLLAHCGEGDEPFRMSESDREYAIRYYYEGLLRDRGISYAEFREALQLFFFYEYCEWIMLGNKYPHEADMERYEQYLKKAKAQLPNIK